MTGGIQYFGIAAADGTSPSYIGIITGGSHRIPSEVREQRGIGSHKAFGYVPGLLTPNGSVNFKVQNNLIIAKAIRTAGGALTEFGVDCGDTSWGALYKNCLCNNLTLHAAAGEELTATFSWMAKTAAEESGAQTQTAATDNPFMWHDFAMTGLTGLTIVSIDISITHRLTQEAVLETPATDAKRFPKYVQDTGQDVISFTLSLRAQGGADITADALAKIASIVITFTRAEGDTLALTLTDAWLSEKNDDFTPDALATKGLIYNCDDLAIT